MEKSAKINKKQETAITTREKEQVVPPTEKPPVPDGVRGEFYPLLRKHESSHVRAQKLNPTQMPVLAQAGNLRPFQQKSRQGYSQNQKSDFNTYKRTKSQGKANATLKKKMYEMCTGVCRNHSTTKQDLL